MFGAFWLSFGGTLQPFYGAAKAYDPTATQAKALTDPTFANTFAYFMVYMGVLCFIFLVASIRTSTCLFCSRLDQRLIIHLFSNRSRLLLNLRLSGSRIRLSLSRFLPSRSRQSKLGLGFAACWSRACLGSLSSRLVPVRSDGLRCCGLADRGVVASR